MSKILILMALSLLCIAILSGATMVHFAMLGTLYALCFGFYMFCKKIALYAFFAE